MSRPIWDVEAELPIKAEKAVGYEGKRRIAHLLEMMQDAAWLCRQEALDGDDGLAEIEEALLLA